MTTKKKPFHWGDHGGCARHDRPHTRFGCPSCLDELPDLQAREDARKDLRKQLHSAESRVAQAEGRLLAVERTLKRAAEQLVAGRIWAEQAREQLRQLQEEQCECGTRLAFIAKHGTSPLNVCEKHRKSKP